MWGTLRSKTAEQMSLRDKFQLLRDAGFAGVEVNSAMNQAEVLAARDAAGLEIPSVCISTHWNPSVWTRVSNCTSWSNMVMSML